MRALAAMFLISFAAAAQPRPPQQQPAPNQPDKSVDDVLPLPLPGQAALGLVLAAVLVYGGWVWLRGAMSRRAAHA